VKAKEKLEELEIKAAEIENLRETQQKVSTFSYFYLQVHL